MTPVVRPEPFFLAMPRRTLGERYCVLHTPAANVGKVRGVVVYVHPFAEEMNKSRRMASLQARALANQGYAILQIDLLGCGDSSGDFADATWEDWVQDAAEAARHLQRLYDAPLWFWGLRAGCLIAAQAAGRLAGPCNFLFWQAPASGKALLQQFLRMKLAGDMLEGQAKGSTDELRARLTAGECVEIAGYPLGPALASGLDDAVLAPPQGGGRLTWMDLSYRADAGPSPSAERALSRWRDAGFAVQHQVVHGPGFWQTSEIETAPCLIEATVAALSASVLEAVPA